MKLSVANWLGIISLSILCMSFGAGGAIAWGRVSDGVKANHKDIVAVEEDISELMPVLWAINVTLGKLEKEMALHRHPTHEHLSPSE